MHKRTRVSVAICPDCEWEIFLGPQPRQGRKVTCLNCGAELELIDVEPLELDWDFSEFEPDWDPDDEESN